MRSLKAEAIGESGEQKQYSGIDLMRSISDIVGSLAITDRLFDKLSRICSYASSNETAKNIPPQEEEVSRHRKSDSSTSTDDTVLNNPPYHAKLKHSHSQSCVAGCTHEHHTNISTWRHPLRVHYSQVPSKLQEPYIEYGYFLPFMPWRYYLRTLYTPSYEMMNVWTHLIPALYFFYLLFEFSQEVDFILAWPLFLVTLSGFSMCSFSAMAHLFHARSSLHHSCWFIADYFGIMLYAFSSLTTNFYSGAQLEYYQSLSSYYLYITMTISVVGFTCLSATQTEQKWTSTKVGRLVKVFVNGFGYFFGAMPLVKRIYENLLFGETEMEMSLKFHAMAEIAMLVASIIYGLDIPQRLCPGTFDVFGHSHMWFHLITASSVWFDIHAVHYDVLKGPWREIHQQVDYPTLYQILFCYILLVLYGLFGGHYTHYAVKFDYPEEEPFLQGKLLCSCGLPKTMKTWRKNTFTKSKSMSCIRESKTEGKED